MLRSHFCDYGDAYIVVKRTIDLVTTNTKESDKAQKDVVFKTNAPFRLFIDRQCRRYWYSQANVQSVRIQSTFFHDIRKFMKLLYSHEIDDVDDNASDGKSFKYKTKIVRRHHEDPYGLEIKEMYINHREYQYHS